MCFRGWSTGLCRAAPPCSLPNWRYTGAVSCEGNIKDDPTLSELAAAAVKLTRGPVEELRVNQQKYCLARRKRPKPEKKKPTCFWHGEPGHFLWNCLKRESLQCQSRPSVKCEFVAAHRCVEEVLPWWTLDVIGLLTADMPDMEKGC